MTRKNLLLSILLLLCLASHGQNHGFKGKNFHLSVDAFQMGFQRDPGLNFSYAMYSDVLLRTSFRYINRYQLGDGNAAYAQPPFRQEVSSKNKFFHESYGTSIGTVIGFGSATGMDLPIGWYVSLDITYDVGKVTDIEDSTLTLSNGDIFPGPREYEYRFHLWGLKGGIGRSMLLFNNLTLDLGVELGWLVGFYHETGDEPYEFRPSGFGSFISERRALENFGISYSVAGDVVIDDRAPTFDDPDVGDNAQLTGLIFMPVIKLGYMF